jgi:broad specificity phosphatase PhoE
MIIGLVRHFKVTFKPDQKWMTSDQFNQWVEQYDKSDIRSTGNFGNGLKWDVCHCSDLSRAIGTAEIIYKGHITRTDQLREIGVQSVNHSRIRLHYYIWLFLGRVAWYLSHKSQKETRNETLLRAREVINKLEENYKESSVLVVSHGVFMRLLIQELKRRGYKGKGFIKPENGKVYKYQKI